MSPPNQILVFAPPGVLLVLRIAHNPHRPKFPHSQILHRPRRRANQNNFPLHVLARVVRVASPRSHVHQLRHYIRRLTVLRQHHRLRCIARNLVLATRHSPLTTSFCRTTLLLFLLHFLYVHYLPKLPCLRIPRRPRPLRPIKNLPIRWKLQYLHIAQPISSRPLRHQLRRRMESSRPALPVKRSYHFQIPLRRLPAQLIRQSRHILLRQKRRLLPRRLTRQQSARDQRHHRDSLRHDSQHPHRANKPGNAGLQIGALTCSNTAANLNDPLRNPCRAHRRLQTNSRSHYHSGADFSLCCASRVLHRGGSSRRGAIAPMPGHPSLTAHVTGRARSPDRALLTLEPWNPKRPRLHNSSANFSPY